MPLQSVLNLYVIVERRQAMVTPAEKWEGKLVVSLVFPKYRIEGVKANCQFALHSRRGFHFSGRRNLTSRLLSQPQRSIISTPHATQNRPRSRETPSVSV
jgi:hypothetical protein